MDKEIPKPGVYVSRTGKLKIFEINEKECIYLSNKRRFSMDVLSTYMIVRKYFENHDDEVIRRGLSLDEAKDHCADDDSSSESCYTTDAIDRTRKMGKWFDCFYKEE